MKPSWRDRIAAAREEAATPTPWYISKMRERNGIFYARYKVGETSRAICPVCKTVRPTTFREHEVPLASGKGSVPNVLVAECDVCHGVVSIPQQSVPCISKDPKCVTK